MPYLLGVREKNLVNVSKVLTKTVEKGLGLKLTLEGTHVF